MARTLDPGGDGDSGTSGGHKRHGAKGHHGRRGGHKGHTGRKARHPSARHHAPRHLRAWPRGGGGHPAGAAPATPHASAHAGPGMAARILTAGLPRAGGASIGGTGLSATILDLVGEGGITLGGALQAWERERDRVANRAWRRPGGLARLGGL
jgi:hypothetical protein